MVKLIEALHRRAINPPVTIPNDLATCPDGMGELARVAQLGNPDLTKLRLEDRIYSFKAEDGQGIAFAYDCTWFVSNSDKNCPGSDNSYIRKLLIEGDCFQPRKVAVAKRLQLPPVIATTGLSFSNFHHLGDISFHAGLLFAMLPKWGDYPPQEGKDPLLLAFSADLDLIGWSRLAYVPRNQSLHPDGSAWCAVNPWDGLLYVPAEGPDVKILGYDVSPFFAALGHRERRGLVAMDPEPRKAISFRARHGEINNLGDHYKQGAVFAPTGHFFITHCSGWPYDNYIRAYCSLSGKLIGEKSFNFEGGEDEIEGITFHASGALFISVTVNNHLSEDDFEIYPLVFT